MESTELQQLVERRYKHGFYTDIEADTVPRGSTALSAGLIPAAGSRAQAEAGIADDPALFAADIPSGSVIPCFRTIASNSSTPCG